MNSPGHNYSAEDHERETHARERGDMEEVARLQAARESAPADHTPQSTLPPPRPSTVFSSPGPSYTHDEFLRDHPQNAEGADRIARPRA